MLKVSGIAMPLSTEDACRGGEDITSGPLLEEAARALNLPASKISSVRVVRRSVDARRKNNVHFVVSVAVDLASATLESQLSKQGFQAYPPYKSLEIPVLAKPVDTPPVVVGTGPAGLFAALYLARAGARPIVLERGEAVEQRAQDVDLFNRTGTLKPHSNIQFGEGGAGTFSDGKLTTNTNNRFTAHVLHWFAEAGAPPEILWESQPHIGSDRLPAVVSAMREEIKQRAGQVRFNTQLSGLLFEEGKLCGVEVRSSHSASIEGCKNPRPDDVEFIPCTHLVLACGHSARDTFAMLQQSGIHLEQKPFSVGVRIEHPQALINASQWGSAAANSALGAASYKLAVHGCAGRSVYTFCMCPGGEVVCAASEEGRLTTNGKSPFARDGNYANAAVLVGVGPEDFDGSTDPLAGVRFQQKLEQRAFEASRAAGGSAYQVPAQTVANFLDAAQPNILPDNSCARGVVACNMRDILPASVCASLAESLPRFERKIQGFSGSQALLMGPEVRSSSPVRIARNENCQAWMEGMPREVGCGIYPAGEGAGYAGGIMSAACDGLRVASELAHLLGASV